MCNCFNIIILLIIELTYVKKYILFYFTLYSCYAWLAYCEQSCTHGVCILYNFI